MYPSNEPGLPTCILITCEHAGREVPADYKHLFRGHNKVLRSHRGSDLGALGVALRLASQLAAPIIFSTVTRLLIDLNRSPDQPDLFSNFTAELTDSERRNILAAFYTPHREAVERTVASAIAAGLPVLHIGVHSCTDVLHGRTRDLDIALLFDETRPHEQDFATRYRSSLLHQAGNLRYPFNQPYKGSDDGLTTTLRHRFKPQDYLGIEVELRQGMILRPSEQRAAGDLLSAALLRMTRTQE